LFPNKKQNTQKVEKEVEKKLKFDDQPPDVDAGYRGKDAGFQVPDIALCYLCRYDSSKD
jgi:hypothetical protein